jgi:hypothetical protein
MTAETFVPLASTLPVPVADTRRPRVIMRRNGDLADMLFEWIPDATLRRRVLVDKPARLYDFK